MFVIIGPILGTLIYSWLGVTVSLICIAVAFFISTVILLLLPNFQREKENDQPPNFLKELKEGINYVTTSKNLIIIAIAFMFIGLGAGIVQPLYIFIIIDQLGLGKEAIQWFYTLYGVGMLIGSITASVLSNKLNVRMVVVVSLCFLSISLIVEVLSVWLALTITMRFLTGFVLAIWQTMLGMTVIKMVDEKLIGRTNGILNPLFIGGVLVGAAIAGPLMSFTNLITAFSVSSTIIFIAAMISTKLKVKHNQKMENNIHLEIESTE